MGFFGALKGAVTAPGKAIGSAVSSSLGATKSAVTGHPIAAAKQMGGGAVASTKPVRRAVSGRR